MKIFLDDERPAPVGYTTFRSGEALTTYIASTNPIIQVISFDNDLGDGRMEGWQVFRKMLDDKWIVESINIHSENVVAVKGMLETAKSYIRHGEFPTVTITNMKARELV